MNTIVYLIRHSEKFNYKLIDTYKTEDGFQKKNEKQVLSVEGERKAEILSKESEFNDLDVLYCSDYVRAISTAKYFVKEGLNLNIDDRFNERKYGNLEKNANPDFFRDQYLNSKLKLEDGESQEEVRNRFMEAYNEIVSNNKGKKIAIISHGTAISFFLMNWCKLLDIETSRLRKFEYNGKVIFNRPFRAPEVFKVTLDDNTEVINIENIEFDDLD